MSEVEQCCGGRRCPLEHNPKKWSILICTVRERRNMFLSLTDKLIKQIKHEGLEDMVEVLYLGEWESMYDTGKKSIGQKRNELIKACNGVYVSFVDDDDDISPDYVKTIYSKLKSNPDCVGITGIITSNGQKPRKFIHSLRYNKYFDDGKHFFRPPNHLCPIRKDIALKVPFEKVNHGEDTDYAMRLREHLQREEFIDHTIYYYKYIVKPAYK